MSLKHLIIFCFAASLFLVGCGGVDVESAPQISVDLTLKAMDSLKFDQAELTAPVGATINLSFENAGSLDHNFLIAAQQEIDLLTITDADAIPGTTTGIVSGGEKQVYTFSAPFKPGEYIFACNIPGHAASGMRGTFIVTE